LSTGHNLSPLEPRCKLCTLVRREPDLWKELHRKIFVEGFSRNKGMIWMNQRADLLNASREQDNRLPHFSKINFARHFKAHITDFSQVEAMLAAGDLFSDKGRADPVKMMFQVAGNEMEDYLRLESLVSSSGAQLAEYEKNFSAAAMLEKARGKKPQPINLEEVKIFQKLVQQQMQMKKELALLQSKQAVAGSALREAMERVVEVVMNATQDALVDLRATIQQEFGSPELADQMGRMVGYKIGEPLKASIPSILDEVYKKYKIR